MWILRLARDNHTPFPALAQLPLRELDAWISASCELNRMENEAWERARKEK